MYQLQCKKSNAFYIGETGQSLLKHINVHQSTSIVVNSYLPVPNHTQSHQFPVQECWSVWIIHKLPDATLDWVYRQFKMANKFVRCRTLLPILTYFFIISPFQVFCYMKILIQIGAGVIATLV